MCLDTRTARPVGEAMRKRNYGLGNTLSIAKLLIQVRVVLEPFLFKNLTVQRKVLFCPVAKCGPKFTYIFVMMLYCSTQQT